MCGGTTLDLDWRRLATGAGWSWRSVCKMEKEDVGGRPQTFLDFPGHARLFTTHCERQRGEEA